MRACFSLVLFAKRAVKTTRLEKLRLFQLIVPFFVMYGFFAIFVCFLCFLRRLDELFVQSCAFGLVSQSHTRAAAASRKKVYPVKCFCCGFFGRCTTRRSSGNQA